MSAPAEQEGVPLVDVLDLADARGLDGGERLLVLDTLVDVIGGAYAHLPAKRAAYAVDPVRALSQLRRRSGDLTDADFHRMLTGLVTGLRDGHTRYVGPRAGQVAALPFLVEQYGPYASPTFVVSKTAAALVADRQFVPGVRIERFNAVPIARAVDVYADRETGGRPDARRARALESFTFRSLKHGPPPDEVEVVVDYETLAGKARRVTFPWRVVDPMRATTAVRPGTRGAAKLAVNSAAEMVRRGKMLMFSFDVWAAQLTDGSAAPSSKAKGASPWIETTFPDNLGARAWRTGGRTVGYLRIWSFDVDDVDGFLAEAERLLALLPRDGVIVDLRGNPGGLVWAAERLLQLFTSRTVTPTRFSLVASPLTRAMAQSPFNRMELEAWAPSLEDAVSTGDLYSQPLPLTDPEWCNEGRATYPGPAVAVVDANTYSSGDLFAAGWVDHGIGELVTVGQATGGGGANVWTSNMLRDALSGTDFAFAALPAEARFTLSVRRAIRSGVSDGIPIEDLGIAGVPYDLTRADLLDGNVDLVAFCAGLLEER